MKVQYSKQFKRVVLLYTSSDIHSSYCLAQTHQLFELTVGESHH